MEFRCRCSGSSIPLPHFWEHTVGSGHAPLALRADYQAQLERCHRELGFRHVRFHGILSDDMYTLTRQQGKLLCSLFNADGIWDFLLRIGMRPWVELSFMPRALASGNTTVMSYRGNVTPPRNYAQWGALIRDVVRHWRERYGAEEVRRWYFEVWNEPNLRAFWTGSQQDYFQLYRHTAEAIKDVDPEFRVGGPATAKNEWIPEFLTFCESEGVAADFVSTHHYPTDAFGRPGQDIRTQLAETPRSVLREQAQDAHRQARGKPLFYTEWNTSSGPRDPLHDEPFAAAMIVKTVLEATGLVQGYSFWTFSDLFEEDYMPSVPFQGGFGLLNIHGIPKPSYRAFEILHGLGEELVVPVDGMHDTVDCWTVRGGAGWTVVLTNHAMPDRQIGTERVRIHLADVPRPAAVRVRRIDADHANPKHDWEQMGEPTYPTPAQMAALQLASELHWEALPWTHDDGVLRLELDIPPHAVAAVTVDTSPAERAA